MKKKTKVRRCGYRKCKKPLSPEKRAHAKFCDDSCRKNERNAMLIASKRCRACGKPLSKKSKVFCDGHLEKAKTYKRKPDFDE